MNAESFRKWDKLDALRQAICTVFTIKQEPFRSGDCSGCDIELEDKDSQNAMAVHRVN